MTDYTFDQEWFNKHVTYWYELSNDTERDWENLVLLPDLPSFDPAFDGTLNYAVDKLNDGFRGITDNVMHATVAVQKMGDLLLETGKDYGVTEEQAADLAGKLRSDD